MAITAEQILGQQIANLVVANAQQSTTIDSLHAAVRALQEENAKLRAELDAPHSSTASSDAQRSKANGATPSPQPSA